MADTLRIVAMALMVIIALFIGAAPIARYFSKSLNITTQDSISIIILILNFLAILVMIITIYANNKSSMEQINTIKNATVDQINAIKMATQNYIDKNEEFNKNKRKALLSALLLEFKENIRWVKDTIVLENELTDESISGRVALAVFSSEAYQANLQNATIDDAKLLDRLVQVYSAFKLFQNFLDTANKPMISSQSRAQTLSGLIKQLKENQNSLEGILVELLKYYDVSKL
ncbi:MAG: hypothetical protein NTX01_00575 [Candidatus Omnitrophica bacterium]|nr:hypothetical protein [Candidatus Omnitrophota bacterium]